MQRKNSIFYPRAFDILSHGLTIRLTVTDMKSFLIKWVSNLISCSITVMPELYQEASLTYQIPWSHRNPALVLYCGEKDLNP